MKMFSENQEFEDDDDQLNNTANQQKEIEEMDEEEIAQLLNQHGIIIGGNNAKDSENKLLYKNVKCMNSLYLFPKGSKFRLFLAKMSKHRYFERAVLTLIVLSSFKLAFDTYIMNVPIDSPINIWSNNVDLIFSIFFACESFIKAVYLGFVQD